MLAVRWRKLSIFLIVGCLSAIPVRGSEWVYVVVPGDNLWKVSEKYLDSVLRFEELRRINNIEDPKRMQPGTRIRVPMDWIPASTPVPAVVEAVSGTASVSRRGGARVPARVGLELMLGDRLRTDGDSSAAVRFADNSILTLYEDSEARFDELSAYGETGMVDSRINLLDGRLDTRVNAAAGPGSRFEIHTPSAISAVRGTEYRASVDQEAASNVEVLEGSVAVSGQASELLIPSGFGTRVEKDKPPLPARELLPAPVLNPLPARSRSTDLQLRWRPVTNASTYRIEISDSAAFDTVSWEELTGETSQDLPALADGRHYLRVRAVDDLGLEGLSASAALEMDAQPRPPRVTAPADGSVFRGTPVELAWQSSSEAEAYRVQIARDAGFTDLVADRSAVRGLEYRPRSLDNGTYYWRVMGIDDAGDEGPLGNPRSFSVRPAAAGPVATRTAPGYGGGKLVTWPDAGSEFRYQIQVASDRGFGTLLRDEIVDEPSFTVPVDPDKAHYYRVRAVSEDGYTGPWSDRERVDKGLKKHLWFIPIGALLVLIAL